VDAAAAAQVMATTAPEEAALAAHRHSGVYGYDGERDTRRGPPPCIGRCNDDLQCVISPAAEHCCFSQHKRDYGAGGYARLSAARGDAGKARDGGPPDTQRQQASLQRDYDYGRRHHWSCWQYNRGARRAVCLWLRDAVCVGPACLQRAVCGSMLAGCCSLKHSAPTSAPPACAVLLAPACCRSV
jgi:hypothetical protein